MDKTHRKDYSTSPPSDTEYDEISPQDTQPSEHMILAGKMFSEPGVGSIDEPVNGEMETIPANIRTNKEGEPIPLTKDDLGPVEIMAQKNMDAYRDTFGELINIGIFGTGDKSMRFEQPEGVSPRYTPRTSSIWRSDSGRYFISPEEHDNKRKANKSLWKMASKRSNVGTDKASITNFLIKGSPALANQVTQCRVCQRDSFFFLNPYEFDSSPPHYQTNKQTEIQGMCRNCQKQKIVKSTRRHKKRVGDKDYYYRGYEWDFAGIAKRLDRQVTNTDIGLQNSLWNVNVQVNGKKKQQAISKRNKSLQKKLKSEDIVSGRAGVQEERELAREASALKVQYVTMASPIQSKLRSKDKKTRDEIVQNYLYGIFDW